MIKIHLEKKKEKNYKHIIDHNLIILMPGVEIKRDLHSEYRDWGRKKKGKESWPWLMNLLTWAGSAQRGEGKLRNFKPKALKQDIQADIGFKYTTSHTKII